MISAHLVCLKGKTDSIELGSPIIENCGGEPGMGRVFGEGDVTYRTVNYAPHIVHIDASRCLVNLDLSRRPGGVRGSMKAPVGGQGVSGCFDVGDVTPGTIV